MMTKMKSLLSATLYRLVVPALIAATGLGVSLGLLSYIA
jgi:hypothetical protein